MSKGSFVHLHVHSEYSLLDGFGTPKSIINRAKELDMDAIALTDHGAMYGAIEFYKAGNEAGVKPIIGLEAYVTNQDHRIKDKNARVETFHLTLLAKNEEGYKNLMKLTTIAHLEGYYYRPKIDKETLAKYSKGLICASGCNLAEIPQLVIADEPQKAKAVASWYQKLFGEDYYLELQRHEYARFIDQATNSDIKADLTKMAASEKLLEGKLVKISRELGIPLVATNDAHYVKAEDAEAQDVLICVQTGKMMADTKRIRFIDAPTFYIRPSQDMEALFADLPEATENTGKIAQKCKLEISSYGKWFFPEIKLDKGKTAQIQLRHLVKEKLAGKYPGANSQVKQRVTYELDIICPKGYATYFLIMADIAEWARKAGIVTNTRGSVAGSIVSYITGITTVDPIKYYLPFERFLNPYRPSPPDIDLDVADDRRDEVIAYITATYGKEKVAQICTFGRMLARAAVRDVARVLAFPYSTGDRIAKAIPPPKQGFPVTVPKALEMSPPLKVLYQEDVDAKRILDLAHKLEGSARHISVHAAGVVIAPTDLVEFAPLQLEPSGDRVITQYEMHAAEDVGLIKIDILGITNLSILGKAVDIVLKTRNLPVDLSQIPLDDQKTFEMLGRGETMGVFQMGSGGITKYLKELKPTVVEDLMVMVALYRPGPMQVIPEYIARKHTARMVVYLDPRMEKFLDKSFGLLVYQDDLLFCAIELAGYTWEEADKFRKAVGKKIPSEMAAQKAKFIKGIIEHGQTVDFAEKLWQLFEPFQAYGFNKAHAASYGMIAYQTAYMKANYPAEYMCALLTCESGNMEKIALGVAEAKRMGIRVLPPAINESDVGFAIVEDEKSLDGRAIRFGFGAIKNVGEAAIEAILAARGTGGEFVSFGDFCRRVDTRRANRKVLESLIKAGALDCFGKRAALLAGIDIIREKAGKAKGSENGQTGLFAADEQAQTDASDVLPAVEDFSQEEKLSLERQLLGLYLTEHPLSSVLSTLSGLISCKIYQLGEEQVGQMVKIGGIIAETRAVTTKNTGRQMCFAQFEDDTGSIELVVFPTLFDKTRAYWNSKKPLVVTGKFEYREDSTSVIVEDVKTVEEASRGQGEGENILRIPRGTKSTTLLAINQLLQTNRGDQDLTILVENGFGERRIKLPYQVAWNSKLEGKIRSLFTK